MKFLYLIFILTLFDTNRRLFSIKGNPIVFCLVFCSFVDTIQRNCPNRPPNPSPTNKRPPDSTKKVPNYPHQRNHPAQRDKRTRFRRTRRQLSEFITTTCSHHLSQEVTETSLMLRNEALARLHTLPFDIIKLDKSFIHQLDQPMVHKIVRWVIAFGQRFGKTDCRRGRNAKPV